LTGNRLSKIYTRTGDDGTTGLGNGERIEKTNIRIDVMGDLDELNSVFGVLGSSVVVDSVSSHILDIQHRLFDIGGELAIPGSAVINSVHVDNLEEHIDTYNEELPALKEFILPGGSLSASICHLARSVCRRAERNLVAMSRNEYINPESLHYINRLSDLLFVLARVLNQENGGKEIFWNSERLKRSV